MWIEDWVSGVREEVKKRGLGKSFNYFIGNSQQVADKIEELKIKGITRYDTQVGQITFDFGGSQTQGMGMVWIE